jgi:hypothetical protein
MTNTAILGNGLKTADAGEHFTDNQQKGESFKNVSQVWLDQCISFDEGRRRLAASQSKIRDHLLPLSAWRPVVDPNGHFALQLLSTGETFRPTEHALKNIAVVGETSDWMLKDLATDKGSNAKKHAAAGGVKFIRDHTDAELTVRIVEHTLFNKSRMDQDKNRLFRTWTDGTLRALLSDQYSIVNNDWCLATFQELIPGGVLSHWRGDADTIFGNILIPDTVRQEADSAYGGMLSAGNSEIGLRRTFSLPSVFRAICMNGCIWEQEKGEALRKVHRGKVDLAGLRSMIVKNLSRQIPLLGDGVRQMLGLRGRGFGDVAAPQMLAATAKSLRISKKHMLGIKEAFEVETAILGSASLTAFGLVASITRYGQKCSDQDWFNFDRIGGTLTMQKDNQWDGLRALGKTITDADEIEKLIGKV